MSRKQRRTQSTTTPAGRTRDDDEWAKAAVDRAEVLAVPMRVRTPEVDAMMERAERQIAKLVAETEARGVPFEDQLVLLFDLRRGRAPTRRGPPGRRGITQQDGASGLRTVVCASAPAPRARTWRCRVLS
jgi:hypothetical protein